MMSDPDSSTPPVAGLLSLLPRLLVGALRKRLDLFTCELKDETQRCLRAFALLAAAICIALLALVSFSTAVILLCSQSYRPIAAAGFGLFYAVTAFLLLLRSRRLAKASPFPRTIEQLAHDAQIITPDL